MLAGRAEPLVLGHKSAVPMAGTHQAPVTCFPRNCHARDMSTCLIRATPLRPRPRVPGPNVSSLWLQVTRMLWHRKPWRSMCKGLVLGTLLTSFMLLLYSYAVPPLQVSVTE